MTISTSTHNLFRRGYTLLFAVIIATLVLSVAVFIASISRKQFALSSSARDSMYAFYAADSGIECVIGNPAVYQSTTTPGNAACAYSSVAVPAYAPMASPPAGAVGTAYSTSFNLGFLTSEISGSGGCADIVIEDYVDSAGASHSIIQSRGYNLCSPSNGPDTTSPRTVERGLQLSY